MDLADIVGGGNGFGTGKIGFGISPITGAVENLTKREQFQGTSSYIPVNTNPYVDGIFIPDGEHGPVQITSTGQQFGGFHDTNSLFWIGVQNGGKHFVPGDINGHYLSLSGIKYGTRSKPDIFMHANQGITFDLEKIRETLPAGTQITRFTALWGVSDSVLNTSNYVFNAVPETINTGEWAVGDCWVLVDGKLRFTKTNQGPKDSPAVIDIPIGEKDRFLTIANTHSEDNQNIGFVWSLFGNPYLQLN